MLADGLSDLTRRADELLGGRPSEGPQAPGEEVVLDETRERVTAAAAAESLRSLAGSWRPKVATFA